MSGFDVFQLAALGAFLTLFAGRTIALRLGDGINPIVLGAGKSGARRAAELVVPVGFAFWVAEVANHALGPRALWLPAGAYVPLFDAVSARAAGVVLTAAGLALFAAALMSFGKSWRVGVDELHPGELVSGGVFAVSRNPIFVFMILYALGGFLINATPVFLAIAVVVAAGVHLQILQEERFLAGRYGRSYEEYRAKTGRYLTLPRRVRV
jgi:protein-S-isoprenylcysteine O-methyltransferase Ste14